mmetsp:Transcript_31182/g.85288  ORF Transcript_31182/g.85288 Transcript_31182/m.85288 type:complete len:219 (+) Transcript_31182:780-1436(+)
MLLRALARCLQIGRRLLLLGHHLLERVHHLEVEREVGGEDHLNDARAHVAPDVGQQLGHDVRLLVGEDLEGAREVVHLEHRLVRVEHSQLRVGRDVEGVVVARVAEVVRERREYAREHVERVGAERSQLRHRRQQAVDSVRHARGVRRIVVRHRSVALLDPAEELQQCLRVAAERCREAVALGERPAESLQRVTSRQLVQRQRVKLPLGEIILEHVQD